jgi:predicted ferric reductase
MKYVIIVIYILFLSSYGYSAYMTSIEPHNSLWGYLCTLIFCILAIISISLYAKNAKKEREDDENSEDSQKNS